MLQQVGFGFDSKYPHRSEPVDSCEMAFVSTQMQLILVVRQLSGKVFPPFTLMLMACGEQQRVSQTDPITTYRNEQIN